MNRKDVQVQMRKLGVDERLIKMPAIVEPIYSKYKWSGIEVLESNKEIYYAENGLLVISGQYIEIRDDGTVKLTRVGNSEDCKILNKYGLEESYDEGDSLYLSNGGKRKNGVVETYLANNGAGTISVTKKYDVGLIYISSSIPEARSFDPDIDGIYEETEESVLRQFDSNASIVVAAYPETKEWYEQTRRVLVKKFKEEQTLDFQLDRKIRELTERITVLENKNEVLAERNEDNVKEINAYLKLLERVKRHPIARKIFREVLDKKEVDKDIYEKKLDEEQRITNLRNADNQRARRTAEIIARAKKEQIDDERIAKIEALEEKVSVLEERYRNLYVQENRLMNMRRSARGFITELERTAITKRVFIMRAKHEYERELERIRTRWGGKYNYVFKPHKKYLEQKYIKPELVPNCK